MHRILKIVLVATVVAMGCAGSQAQSTSPSSPTPLTSSYSGKGPAEETDYYFSVTGGPGEVSITLKLSAKQYSTFARLEVTDAAGNTLATLNMDAASSTGISQQVRSFSLAKKQTVRLNLTLDRNLEDYSISVGGAAAGGEGALSPVGKNPNGRLSSTRPRPAADAQNEVSGTATPAASAEGGRLGRIPGATARQTLITVRCPNSVNVGVREVPTGWLDAAPRNIAVTGISASSRFVTCEYKDTYYNASLVQTAPEGFECNVPNLGPKTAECRRKVQIKATN